MGASDFLSIFQAFVDVMRADPELATTLTQTTSYTVPPPLIKASDDGLAWFPDGRHLAYVKLISRQAAPGSQPTTDRAGRSSVSR